MRCHAGHYQQRIQALQLLMEAANMGSYPRSEVVALVLELAQSETDLDVMGRIKSVFNPEGLCNPGKIFPTSKGCVEVMLKARSVAL